MARSAVRWTQRKTTLGMLIVALTLALATSASTPPPNLSRALAEQFELVAEEPDVATVRNDLGNLLVLDGRLEEAEEAYRDALGLDPEYAAAHFNLAVLLQQTGRWREAQEQYGRLLEIEPFHAWGHYQLGVVLDHRSQRSAALEHYARALAYDPELTFDSNNPHIIENRLFAEALLLSLRYSEPPGSRVPRHYGEPDRIIELMLEEEEGEEVVGEDEEDSAAEPSAPRGELPPPDEMDSRLPSAGGSHRWDESEEPRDHTGAGRPAGGSQPVDSRRVLTNTNIETGSQLGKSQTGGSRARTPARRSPSPSPSPLDRSAADFSSRLSRPPATPDSGRRAGSTTGFTAPGPTAGSTGRGPTAGSTGRGPTAGSTTPGGTAQPSSYHPGRRSTAQLELRLLPEESPQQVAMKDPS
ncbi:MAG: tetratricopeptide repeat protein [bacterium]|nr:tetratricopeptide repeat protein [bacterium]